MGFRLDFDRENAILLLSVQGAVNDKLMLDGYDLIGSCSKHFGECNYILDYTEATDISLSEDTLRDIAQKAPKLSPLCFQVIVAPQEMMYKFARIFQFATSKTRPTFQVVHTMDEALKLLEARSPTFFQVASSLQKPSSVQKPSSLQKRAA
jgi:hypothetical protein